MLNVLQMNKNNYGFCAVALGSAHVKFDFETRPETGNLKVKKKTSWSLDSGSTIRKAWLLWEWGGGGGGGRKNQKNPSEQVEELSAG